jgi:hypothetical protein
MPRNISISARAKTGYTNHIIIAVSTKDTNAAASIVSLNVLPMRINSTINSKIPPIIANVSQPVILNCRQAKANKISESAIAAIRPKIDPI